MPSHLQCAISQGLTSNGIAALNAKSPASEPLQRLVSPPSILSSQKRPSSPIYSWCFPFREEEQQLITLSSFFYSILFTLTLVCSISLSSLLITLWFGKIKVHGKIGSWWRMIKNKKCTWVPPIFYCKYNVLGEFFIILMTNTCQHYRGVWSRTDAINFTMNMIKGWV